MSRIDDLAEQYGEHIKPPWQRNLAGAQRTIFVVYPKEDERRMQTKLREFEHRTKAAGHTWREVDLTNTFADWMAAEKYREQYFKRPKDLALKYEREFKPACVARLSEALGADEESENSVLAVHGVAGLYGFTFLHEVLKAVETLIRGRVVVFFPGSYDQNTYRLLDARDGWNYMAIPITGMVTK
ncbi:MAG: DUF1788 domain-containing protein [Verrucomicrobia bacterium]|nr:DUF1788 domain-containing protein [Verrucomicrobiota bacterium]